MTDKEFKRLTRSQLIEIIYQFQLKQDELIAENERLTKELADKRLRIAQAGNIAEAVLAVNNVMQDAQNAARQYLDEIRAMHGETEAECQRIRQKAMEEAEAILARTREEAAAVQTATRKKAAAATPQTAKRGAASDVQAQRKEAVASVPVKKDEKARSVGGKQKQEDTLLEAILAEFGNGTK